MKRRRIVYLSSARQDLADLTQLLMRTASTRVARQYVRRVIERISSLRYAGERGTIRDPATGLRMIGMLSSVTVAFVVDGDQIVVHRILYLGRSSQDFPPLDADD